MHRPHDALSRSRRGGVVAGERSEKATHLVEEVPWRGGLAGYCACSGMDGPVVGALVEARVELRRAGRGVARRRRRGLLRLALQEPVGLGRRGGRLHGCRQGQQSQRGRQSRLSSARGRRPLARLPRRDRAEVMKLEAVSQLDRLHVKDCETLHKIATARVIRSRASSPGRKLLHRRPATSLLPTCSFPPPFPL